MNSRFKTKSVFSFSKFLQARVTLPKPVPTPCCWISLIHYRIRSISSCLCSSKRDYFPFRVKQRRGISKAPKPKGDKSLLQNLAPNCILGMNSHHKHLLSLTKHLHRRVSDSWNRRVKYYRVSRHWLDWLLATMCRSTEEYRAKCRRGLQRTQGFSCPENKNSQIPPEDHKRPSQRLFA